MNIWNWVKNNPNRFMFLIPILLVAGISISHVVTWYDIANPLNWAIYLSIAIEVGAMSALVAATNRISGGVWFMFGLVTFIQMIGNIFYSFNEIDETGKLFKTWVELTGPIWESFGTELTDTVGLKRYLAYLEGGLLPIISLTSLHFFVKYDKEVVEEKPETEEYFNSRNKYVEKMVSERELNRVFKKANEISKKGKVEMGEDEPTALSFTYNIIEDDFSDLDITLNDGLEEYPYEEEGNGTVDEFIVSLENGEEIIEQPEVDDIYEEISKSFDEQPDVTLVTPQKGDIDEEVIIQDVVVKQPLTPPKTNIQRID